MPVFVLLVLAGAGDQALTDRLAKARSALYAMSFAEAERDLERIAADAEKLGPHDGPDVLAEARTLLVWAALENKGEARAREHAVKLLRARPDVQVSPAQYPPHLVAFIEGVRRELQARAAQAAEPVQPVKERPVATPPTAEPRADDARAAEARAAKARTNDARAAEARAANARATDARAAEARTANARTDEAHAAEARADEAGTTEAPAEAAVGARTEGKGTRIVRFGVLAAGILPLSAPQSDIFSAGVLAALRIGVVVHPLVELQAQAGYAVLFATRGEETGGVAPLALGGRLRPLARLAFEAHGGVALTNGAVRPWLDAAILVPLRAGAFEVAPTLIYAQVFDGGGAARPGDARLLGVGAVLVF